MGTQRHTPAERHQRPSRITVIKDLVLFTVGLALIYRQGWQVSKDDFNWITLAVGVGLTQAPGAMAVVSLIRTGGGSSPAPSDPPSSPLPSSSPSGSLDDQMG